MSLVPSTYRCCQPHADLAVSGKAAAPGPVRPQEARRPGRRAAGQPAGNHEIWLLPQQKGINDRRFFRRARAAGHQTNTTPRS